MYNPHHSLIIKSTHTIFNFTNFSRTLPPFQKTNKDSPMKFSTVVPFKFAVLLTVFFLLMIPDGKSVAQGLQILSDRPVIYKVSTSLLATTGETPFWHYANTNGQIRSGSSVNNLTNLAFAVPFKEDNDGIDFSLGANLAGRLSDTGNTLHFQELYGSLQLGVFRLSIGKFYRTIGLNMTELSTGSMIQSNNAPPLPRISLDMTRFLDVPLTNGIVQFKGHYADGKLENDRFVDSPFLHQKSFHLKFNIERAELIGGFLHNVVWGGTHPNFGKLPQSFSDYLRVVVGKSAESQSNTPGGEQSNRLGNTVAAYDTAIRYNFNKFRITGYRMFYLEDSVSMRFRSFWDGLYGLGFRKTEGKHLFSGVVYEFLNTIQQDSPSGLPKGRINYYGHFLYQSGWTFNGSVLGNPLIRFDSESGRIDNNMIIAHHAGFDGWITERLQYKAFATYSRNYGVCTDQIITGRCLISAKDPNPPELELIPRSELRRDQYSVVVETVYRLKTKNDFHLKASVAFDAGDFLEDHSGILLGIVWNGIF